MAERPKPRILFVALVNNVGCERIIAEMSRHGALCAVMSSQGYYCTKLECSSPYFPLPDLPSVWLTSQFVRRRLESAVLDWDPVLVVPLDDIAAWLLRSLAIDRSVTQKLRDLLVESLGSPGGYAASIHRGQLMQVAARIGVRKPRHWHVAMPAQDVDVSAGRDFPLFLKIDHTCGGDGVTAVNDVGELRAVGSRPEANGQRRGPSSHGPGTCYARWRDSEAMQRKNCCSNPLPREDRPSGRSRHGRGVFSPV